MSDLDSKIRDRDPDDASFASPKRPSAELKLPDLGAPSEEGAGRGGRHRPPGLARGDRRARYAVGSARALGCARRVGDVYTPDGRVSADPPGLLRLPDPMLSRPAPVFSPGTPERAPSR